VNQFSLGLQLMVYGLIGVFAVLIVSYLTIRLMVALFPEKATEETEHGTASSEDSEQS